ncbi:MAG TPA: hypothetical protein VNY05_24960 [Candidatus Acidoferrales bacterium]|jgi:hypothetical protein|nr:hypothetical protein [Candidatus Acidoferrales bacterium]
MRNSALLKLALFLLAAYPLGAQLPKPVRTVSTAAVNPTLPNPAKTTKIAPQNLKELESRFDMQLASIGGPNDPIDILGTTRGLYLDGYGAVFTSEMSLIITPRINPFHQQMTKEEVAAVHRRKSARLPLLKQAMADMMKNSALALTQIPDSQQIVVAVRLLYLPYEDTTGLPAQVLMSASRRDILNGQIKTEEQ